MAKLKCEDYIILLASDRKAFLLSVMKQIHTCGHLIYIIISAGVGSEYIEY